MLQLEEHVRAARRRGRQQDERADLLLALGCEHRDHPALAVAGDRNPPRIDIVALGEPLDDGDEVVGVVGLRHGFTATAALSDPALVIAEHEKSLLRECTGELTQDRDAGDGAVPLDRARARDEHDCRQPEPAEDCWPRQSTREAEAIGRNGDV